jgi:hypothetical protein
MFWVLMGFISADQRERTYEFKVFLFWLLRLNVEARNRF